MHLDKRIWQIVGENHRNIVTRSARLSLRLKNRIIWTYYLGIIPARNSKKTGLYCSLLRQRKLVPNYVLCKMVAMVYCKKRGAKIISILGIFVNATLFVTLCIILQSLYDPTYRLLKNTRFSLLLKWFDWLLGMSVTLSLLGIFMNSLLYYGLKKNRRIFMLPWIMWTLPKLVVIFQST